jgi:hypothetical protein
VWRPAPGTTWQLQLTGSPFDSWLDVEMYDLDLFDTDPTVIATLHQQGRKAICYISAGTFENWRPDVNRFPASAKGKSNGWPGEKWLDIRQLDVLGPIMEARMDLCKAKGFDGIDPDNVDGYTNNTGFPLSSVEQMTFNIFLANAAHARGLSVGLKNDVSQVKVLEPLFDWALNEECFRYKECDLLKPFVQAGKAVFHVEYNQEPAAFCPATTALGFSSLKKNTNLDAYRVACESVVQSGTPVTGNFDRDGKTDLALYRASTGSWHIRNSSTNYATGAAYQWGLSSDLPVPGDYDGDGLSDLAVYRPSTGTWYILQSSTNYTNFFARQWGSPTDLPVPGDYDGDGRIDLGVYRPSTGTWYILQSNANYSTYVAYQWGISTDAPVPGDYDGDGKTDLGLYRSSAGIWYILQSSTAFTTYQAQQWGISTDIPVPGDYDGDGKTDLGLYRPAEGTWYLLQSRTNYTTYAAHQWGLSTDTVVPADYDGDGKTDLALYRPSTGIWYILQSITGYATYLSAQ